MSQTGCVFLCLWRKFLLKYRGFIDKTPNSLQTRRKIHKARVGSAVNGQTMRGTVQNGIYTLVMASLKILQ